MAQIAFLWLRRRIQDIYTIVDCIPLVIGYYSELGIITIGGNTSNPWQELGVG